MHASVTEMSLWCVYDHPIDIPTHYVARRFIVDCRDVSIFDGRATNDVIMSTDLELVRRELRARGLYSLPRFPQDDPKIIETWL